MNVYNVCLAPDLERMRRRRDLTDQRSLKVNARNTHIKDCKYIVVNVF